ncbi:MAG: hypothetical protein QOE31_151 [Solirubrobacteraceae bacterium]|jgi:hypothetical protein|nr:hypothetical protein [Solirubrobacteraceae bacterium]
MTYARTQRNIRLGALATVAAAALLGTASAQAAGTTSAVCAPQLSVTISPGFRLTPGSGTLSSGGETGSIICSGEVDGHHVTGPGTVGLDETYAQGDCLSHVGTGTVRVSIPTTAGVVHLVGAATSRRTALGLLADAQFPGVSYSGVGLAIPTQGDCLLTPMRQALITVSGLLSGS